MPVPPLRSPVRATRRTTIAAASALVLTGCRWGPDEEQPTPAPQPDADTTLVELAAVAIATQEALLGAMTDVHRGLAKVIAPLQAVHASHRTLLVGDQEPEVVGSLGPVGRKAAQALAQLRRSEDQLRGTLADLAIDAESGQLARALASMSASIAQHVAVLPELGRGPA